MSLRPNAAARSQQQDDSRPKRQCTAGAAMYEAQNCDCKSLQDNQLRDCPQFRPPQLLLVYSPILRESGTFAMVHRVGVTVVPTLSRMAEIYSLSRDGGHRSPRFAAYRSDVDHHWGLSAYNPMAGAAASASVDALLALDAEGLAQAAAEAALARCEWREPITLAVVVATPGMWTDRLATEVRHRTTAARRACHGEIMFWTGDAPSTEAIQREGAAEAVRTMWTSLHGPTLSLHAVLAREGMAYALSRATTSHAVVDAHVSEAIKILGDTNNEGDIVAVLYGDEAAVALGYTPLGISEDAGYACAIARARALVARIGADQALRSAPAELWRQG